MNMTRLAGSQRWASWLASLLAIGVLAGLLVYWLMVLLAPAVVIAPSGSLVNQAIVDTTAANDLFGRIRTDQAAPAEPLPRNIQVVGVVAGGPRSVAIITVDNQPAAPFMVGQTIADGLTVESIDRREVVMLNRGESIRVPTPKPADLAVLTNVADESRQADDASTAQSTGGAAVRTTPATRPGGGNPRANPAGAADKPMPANLSPLPPRRLPPAGADAAAAAAQNTTGGPAPPGSPGGTAAPTPGGNNNPPGQVQPTPNPAGVAPGQAPGSGGPPSGGPQSGGPSGTTATGSTDPAVRSALGRALQRLDGVGNRAQNQ